MSDRACVCGKEFPYPYLLERHLKSSINCKNVYIMRFGNNISNTVNESSNDVEFICNDCKKKYSNKQNLNRHITRRGVNEVN